jgi:ankyrin repeat protein
MAAVLLRHASRHRLPWRADGRLWRGLRAAGLAAGLVLAAAGPSLAHESEQFTMPVGREFADLGPYISRIFHDAIARAVAETNAAIADASSGVRPAARLSDLQSATYIADRVWGQLFIAIPANELLDLQLVSEPVRAQFPGLVTVHQPARSIYNDGLLVVDPTKFVRTFFRAGTISAGGTEFGSDKIIHFIHVGRIYHAKFETRRDRGVAEEKAIRAAIASTGRNPLLSEEGVLGKWTTGIRSNGDLAADYAGMTFYRNLTEEVRVGARVLPPMLVRDGPYWRMRIEPGADVFTAFVTPHWNEALNPSKYIGYARGRIRALVRERCAETRAWYRDERGRPLSRARFEAIERELATWHGAFYDHQAGGPERIGVATLCFPQGDDDAQPAAVGAEPDGLGRSDLWWAARAGDAAAVDALAGNGPAMLAPDRDGETPLHAAVRGGHEKVVQRLLDLGADPNHAALYGVTPLMLASSGGNAALAEALIRGGADPNRRDLFGKTAVFDAVRRGHAGLTELLLDHGADVNLVDDAGNTLLHLAARRGDEAAVKALLQRGARAGARNATGATAEAEARRYGHRHLAAWLRDGDASVASRRPAAAEAGGSP